MTITKTSVKVWVVDWDWDWQTQGSRLFTSLADAEQFAIELFEVDHVDEINEAYGEGKWKCYGLEEHSIDL